MVSRDAPPPQRDNRILAAAAVFGTLLLMVVLGLGIRIMRNLAMQSRAVSVRLDPTNAPAPMSQVATSWEGEYFDNASMSGTPVLVRNDDEIDFDWKNGPPDPLPADNFSVRWTRAIQFTGDMQRFTVSADDGARVYLDDVLLIDAWHASTGQPHTRDAQLTAGVHDLRVEMVERLHEASIRFFHEPVPPVDKWKGEYFDNRDLAGSPVLVRDDPAVTFFWGAGSPGPHLPPDGFSARWTRTLVFAKGVLQLFVGADDGVRVWIDDDRIIDEWHDAAPRTYTADVDLVSGEHTFVIEYYENTGSASIFFSFQPADFPDWMGEYFAVDDLTGDPVLIRNDLDIDFSWGEDSPASNVPVDNFSARWTRVLSLVAGQYRFSLDMADGVRLYVDYTLILDEWHDGSMTYTVTVDLSGGPHSIRVEYYAHLDGAHAHLEWVHLPDTPAPIVTPSDTSTPSARNTGRDEQE